MSEQLLRLSAAAPAAHGLQPSLPLGRFLVRNGVISQDQLVRALEMQLYLNAPIGEILVSEGWAEPQDILTALALQNGVPIADLVDTPPAPTLCELKSSQFWIGRKAIPWMQLGPMILIATSRPDQFDTIRTAFDGTGVMVLPALASEEQIDEALAKQFATTLALAAETRVEPVYSCRNWRITKRLPAIVATLCTAALAIAAPTWALTALFLIAVLTLAMFATLKGLAFVTHLLGHSHLTAPRPQLPPETVGYKYPKVSVLVPLFKEREIASALISRLSRLTYPKSLLDVVLVLEEEDDVTRQTVAETDLPAWIRVIEVPAHTGLTTKPRAMNYALDFCRGDIIGVWDAEDAPMADQIEHVVSRFAHTPDDVVCLQGILDYYNPRSSWRARCFTIEYSSWFRIILPGIARMGLVVPLGGTTLFFKRDALEELGGWDAHNVTEDADLGVRLCRAGYRTELIDTVTYEEANFRAWPWIKQRSRWLKGFMVTYLVHMRSPRQLWRDLGVRRFLGVQAFFLGTFGQFLLAPVLWSFWLILLGFDHPIQSVLPAWVIHASVGLFVATELLALAVGLTSVSRKERRFLMPWVPTMILYFPLGVVAAYKALYELAAAPFFWDKTQHGHADEEQTPDQA